MSSKPSHPCLGLALGGGSARGWAHIGVLSALAQHGIEPAIVCGTSAGALVGGIWAAGRLPELEAWVGRLTRRDVVALLDFTMARGGAIGGRKLIELYRRQIGDLSIEDLPHRFAAVATELETGSEVWLQHGPLLHAIRASISLPGMFTPVLADGRWLVDGGLVNPVPVTLCRALGAEIVIAVDLHGSAGRPEHRPRAESHPAVVRDGRWWQALSRLRRRAEDAAGEEAAAELPDTPEAPSTRAVIAAALDIMQARISRSRLAGDPPDLLLSPTVRHIAPLDFACGQPTIDEGYDVVRRMLPAIRDLLGLEAEESDVARS